MPEGKIGQEMLPFAHIQFDNVRLDESWRLSGLPGASLSCSPFFEYGRVFACATALVWLKLLWMMRSSGLGSARPREERVRVPAGAGDAHRYGGEARNMRHMVYKAAWEFDHGCHERLTVAL